VHGDVPLMGMWLLGREARTSALFYILGQLSHGLLRDDAAFATGKRGFRFIDGGENFGAGTLAFLPQGKGFLHCIFFAVKASALDCLADKRFLIGGELYFHRLQGRQRKGRCQVMERPLLPAARRPAVSRALQCGARVDESKAYLTTG
jgi:hypothetical protein